jgi:hypothetical protein
MSYKPDESILMAYLYDELPTDERKKVEVYLHENPHAMKQLQHMLEVRKMLAVIKDKEVIAPPVVMDNSRHRFLWNAPYAKTIMGIAASLIIVLLVGKLTNMQMSYSANEFRLSFGEPMKKSDATQANSITALEVQQMINASLTENNQVVQGKLEASQQKLDESIRKNLAMNSSKIDALVRQASQASQDDIREYVAGIQTQNQQLVKDYFQLTTKEQQKYMESLLVDFTQYLQQQRKNDFETLQTRLLSVEQNTNVFKQETEQILASIISNSSTTGSGKNY